MLTSHEKHFYIYKSRFFYLDPHQIVHIHIDVRLLGLGKGPLSASQVMVRGIESKMCSFFWRTYTVHASMKYMCCGYK